MRQTFLFDHRLKKISGIIFLISLLFFISLGIDYEIFEKINPRIPVFAIIGNGELVHGTGSETAIFPTYYFSWIYNGVLDEILFTLLIVSGIVFVFSKERTEDEMIRKIRMESLAWATYFNYAVLLLAYLLFYGLPFLQVLAVSMFSNLLFFILRFRWKIYQYKKEFDEEYN